ncbi:MAG: Rne/Rng family ribonuclease [Arenibacterium sp.]
MAKKMLIDATHAEETRVVVVDGNKVEEFDFESENKRQLAGNIYLAKVTRVEPSLQAAFVDYGGNRHGFLAFSEIHPDYYQIPVADRQALMEEERAYAEAMRARDEEEATKSSAKSKSAKSGSKSASVASDDPIETKEISTEISGMETIDLSEEQPEADDVPEGTSPMETVAETPVEEPDDHPDTEGTLDGSKTPPTDDAETDATGAQATEENSTEIEAQSDDLEVQSDLEEQNVSEKPLEDADGPDAEEDDNIESVADVDDVDEIRPPRKPRPRRYKIQEVIKVRQVLLVQVVKEERGNKGAALTTYLSLAGRYCVLMPNTARGGGISRKITSATDRKKLKEIAAEIDVPQGAGLIVRTAGAKRTKAEIKRDYEYLQRLWEQIRELTLKSIAPAKIYEEGDLIKRSIRDLYNRDIDEVFVEGERGYRSAKDFMKMIMPSHAKNVKLYAEKLPLFARYQVESYLAGMFNPTVQLKSGGYIVIGVTEALVAVDVNSGRATKEGSIEETALKTNLEAADEVARQLRLRDLAGLIVIDFIDMDERKNNSAVEKRMKDRLKTDRARIQVGRISGFGLMEMSRQRLRPGMIEATTQACPACHGTGLIRSDDNMALSILRQIEEEGVRRRSREVLVKCPVGIANYLMNAKREHVAQIEGRYGLSVRIEGDPHLVSPDFQLEKFKTATRSIVALEQPVVSVDTSLMEEIDADVDQAAEEPVSDAQPDNTDGDAKPKKKRRRRRRRSGKSNNTGSDVQENADATPSDNDGAVEAREDDAPAPETPVESADIIADLEQASDPEVKDATEKDPTEKEAKPSSKKSKSSKSRSSSSRSRSSSKATEESPAASEAAEPSAEAVSEPVEEPVEEAETKPKSTRSRSTKAKSAKSPSKPKAKKEPEAEESAPTTVEAPANSSGDAQAVDAAEPISVVTAPEVSEPVPEEPAKPKRRGWWSLGS